MILDIQNISFGFSKASPLFKELSISFEERKIYALMGANGAGKTTLFNLITGFYRPFSGQINFRQSKINGIAPYKINRLGVARTFQDLRLINKLTVKENVILAMQENPTDNWVKALLPERVYREVNKSLETKAEGLMEMFFIGDVKSFLAGEISYGQQKLLSLACIVANGASLLLLDEPIAGVQPEYRNKIAVLIRQLKEQGKTIIVIEHNTDFIADIADKILFLHEGCISSFDDMDMLRKDTQVINAYM